MSGLLDIVDDITKGEEPYSEYGDDFPVPDGISGPSGLSYIEEIMRNLTSQNEEDYLTKRLDKKTINVLDEVSGDTFVIVNDKGLSNLLKGNGEASNTEHVGLGPNKYSSISRVDELFVNHFTDEELTERILSFDQDEKIKFLDELELRVRNNNFGSTSWSSKRMLDHALTPVDKTECATKIGLNRQRKGSTLSRLFIVDRLKCINAIIEAPKDGGYDSPRVNELFLDKCSDKKLLKSICSFNQNEKRRFLDKLRDRLAQNLFGTNLADALTIKGKEVELTRNWLYRHYTGIYCRFSKTTIKEMLEPIKSIIAENRLNSIPRVNELFMDCFDDEALIKRICSFNQNESLCFLTKLSGRVRVNNLGGKHYLNMRMLAHALATEHMNAIGVHRFLLKHIDSESPQLDEDTITRMLEPIKAIIKAPKDGPNDTSRVDELFFIDFDDKELIKRICSLNQDEKSEFFTEMMLRVRDTDLGGKHYASMWMLAHALATESMNERVVHDWLVRHSIPESLQLEEDTITRMLEPIKEILAEQKGELSDRSRVDELFLTFTQLDDTKLMEKISDFKQDEKLSFLTKLQERVEKNGLGGGHSKDMGLAYALMTDDWSLTALNNWLLKHKRMDLKKFTTTSIAKVLDPIKVIMAAPKDACTVDMSAVDSTDAGGDENPCLDIVTYFAIDLTSNQTIVDSVDRLDGPQLREFFKALYSPAKKYLGKCRSKTNLGIIADALVNPLEPTQRLIHDKLTRLKKEDDYKFKVEFLWKSFHN